MLEEDIRREVYHIMFDLGFWPHHPEDSHKTRGSRPDLFCLNSYGPNVVIEVKKMEPLVKAEPWIDPAIISYGQREWLDNWVYRKEGPGYLAIGTTWQPRRLWIIPWNVWNMMEQELIQKNIDTEEEGKFRIELSALERLSLFYECIWCGTPGHEWKLNERHPVREIPVQEPVAWSRDPVSWRPPQPQKAGKK